MHVMRQMAGASQQDRAGTARLDTCLLHRRNFSVCSIVYYTTYYLNQYLERGVDRLQVTEHLDEVLDVLGQVLLQVRDGIEGGHLCIGRGY